MERVFPISFPALFKINSSTPEILDMKDIALTPAEFTDVKERTARQLTEHILANVKLDELALIDLTTAATFMGVRRDYAAKVLPVISFGPRTQRVSIAAYKAYVTANTKQVSQPNTPLS